MDFADVPTRDDITGGELFQSDAENGAHFQGIDLDQISGLGRLISNGARLFE